MTTRPALDAPLVESIHHIAFGTVVESDERSLSLLSAVVVVVILLILSSLFSVVNRKHACDALNKDVIDVKDVEFIIVQARKRRQLVVKAGW